VLQIHQVSKSFGPQHVLDRVSLVVNEGERVALIGPNGSGKTTLIRIIVGLESPDGGSVTLAPGLRVGYLTQVSPADEVSVAAVLDSAGGGFAAAEAALEAAAAELARPGAGEVETARYEHAQAAFDALGGYARAHRAAAILGGLGLGSVDSLTLVGALSGGQKTRLGLAAVLLAEPDLLLLDEPTNHLDVEALEWLEGFVAPFPGAVLVVSHDREFLDRTVTSVVYLDPRTHQARRYAGNYSAFAAERLAERGRQERAWKEQHEYVAKVKGDIARLKGEALAIERSTTPRQPGVRRHARRKARVAIAREKKLERYLASDERVEKPRDGWGLHLDFGPAPEVGKTILRLDHVTAGYDGTPPVLQECSLLVRQGERVAVSGANGSGKTTLLRVVAGTVRPSAGDVWLGPAVRPGYLAQEQETLDMEATVLQLAVRQRPTSEAGARNFLHFFLFSGDDVFRRVGLCSPGERTRLQLALLVLRGCNLLLLDEPLNHLDIDGREHFQAALEAFAGTVLVVAHDRRFLQTYPTRVVELEGGGMRDEG
jgi:ATP-binding cassette subfamily F protein 3